MDSKQIYDYILKIQSIAKIGLVYSKDPYAITNYNEINNLSMKFLEEFLEVEFDRPNYFKRDIYPTPNVSVRTVIFNEDKTKVLFAKLPDLSLISNGLLWITAILTIISGVIYLNDSKKIIDFTK